MGNKANIAANYADNTMLGVYELGSIYTIAEYGAVIARKSDKRILNAFSEITPYFGPIWNFVDAVGVVADAVKDYENEDNLSCFLNSVSSAQLAAGTLVGLLKTHTQLVGGLSASTAAFMSSGSFAVCMFFSAAVSTYKYYSLGEEIKQLANNKNTPDIESRIRKRHPNLGDTHLSTNKMTRILTAEQSYQKTAISAWTACGVAMSLVAYTLHESCPVEVKILTGALVLLSAGLRARLKTQETSVESEINEISNDNSERANILASTYSAGVNGDKDTQLPFDSRQRRRWGPAALADNRNSE